MAVRGVHAACMTKQGRMAHKTDDEIEVARLHWDALPNLLTSVSALDPGPECDIQYNQPFYCDCSRSLYQSSLGSPWQKSSCGESGVDIRQKRKQLFAARMQYSIAFTAVLPFAIAFQVCYRLLCGADESPSSLAVACMHAGTCAQNIHKWLLADKRRIAAIVIPMIVPVILLVIAVAMACSGQRWETTYKRVPVFDFVIVAPLSGHTSLLICQEFLPHFHIGHPQHSMAAEDGAKPTATVCCALPVPHAVLTPRCALLHAPLATN